MLLFGAPITWIPSVSLFLSVHVKFALLKFGGLFILFPDSGPVFLYLLFDKFYILVCN